jgi:hypothetical protein
MHLLRQTVVSDRQSWSASSHEWRVLAGWPVAFAAALATIRETRALDLPFKTDVLSPSLGWAFLLTLCLRPWPRLDFP